MREAASCRLSALSPLRGIVLLRGISVSLLMAMAFAGISSCASSPKKPGTGFRSLEATVVSREFEPPGSGGASYAGSGNYYLVFEAKDGDATATYRFPVTKTQYTRYTEGSRVQILLADNELREIRPAK